MSNEIQIPKVDLPAIVTEKNGLAGVVQAIISPEEITEWFDWHTRTHREPGPEEVVFTTARRGCKVVFDFLGNGTIIARQPVGNEQTSVYGPITHG